MEGNFSSQCRTIIISVNIIKLDHLEQNSSTPANRQSRGSIYHTHIINIISIPVHIVPLSPTLSASYGLLTELRTYTGTLNVYNELLSPNRHIRMLTPRPYIRIKNWINSNMTTIEHSSVYMKLTHDLIMAPPLQNNPTSLIDKFKAEPTEHTSTPCPS